MRIGSGSPRPTGVRFGGGAVRGIVRDAAQTLSIPEIWIYIAVIVVLLAIVAALIFLIIREYNLQKKKKQK